jgi:hypothetical protein
LRRLPGGPYPRLFWDRLWEKTENGQSQLVFIGKGLRRESVEKSLTICLES